MPRTIRNYAIDFNKNKIIELKNTEDSLPQANEYLNKLDGKDKPCFFKINLKKKYQKDI